MSFIKKVKNKIIKRIAPSLFHEFKKIENEIAEQNEKQKYNGFKKLGKGSFFWGKTHLIYGKEYCEIGENVHINDNAFIKAEGGLIIGDNTHISRNLVLYTINHDYKGDLLPYDSNMIKKGVVIGKNVWIGMNVCITPGSNIGDGCIIGMGTTVSGNIPPLSIIASPKAVMIGKRDESHYMELESNKKYGGADGVFYNWSKNFCIEEVGDKYQSQRSVSEVIFINETKAVKKTFSKSKDSIQAFKNEILGYHKFQKFDWCPKLLETGENYIVTEFLPSNNRLDKIHKGKNIDLLGDIIFCLLDIFIEGFAHCDFHAKNIYINESSIKIIDFESLQQQSNKIDFFTSYDITGNGLESPFQTANMCVFSKNEFSIAEIFKVSSVNNLKEILNCRIKEQMLDSSITFKSLNNEKKDRYTLQTKNIYSTFNLKHTNVTIEEGQRNTLKRFERFGISSEIIKGKSILDIGSNIGGTLLGLAQYEPKYMIGLEYDYDKVKLANKIAILNEIVNVKFIEFDIESQKHIPEIVKYDVVFCLAVIEHLKNKENLFCLLEKVCSNILYFEGNAYSDIAFIESRLKESGFSRVEYIGFSCDEKNETNNNRPLFIAYKTKPF